MKKLTAVLFCLLAIFVGLVSSVEARGQVDHPRVPSTANTTPVPTATTTISPNSVSFPLLFRSSSRTTVLSSIPSSQQKNYTGLTFDITTSGTIKFNGPVDLTNQALLQKFMGLDSYVQIGRGYISVDTAQMPQLKDIPATLTMKGLSLTDGKYTILRDGQDATSYISNVKYDSLSQTLTFDAKGFSRYEIKIQTDVVPEDKTKAEKNENRMMVALGVLGGLSILLFIIMAFLVYERRSRND